MLIGFIIIKSKTFFTQFIINKLIFINVLLNINIYKRVPINIPMNTKPLNSPLLNLNIEYNIISAVIIQNTVSCTYVTQFLVLKLFLNILKKSNINPIINPLSIKIPNKYTWFSNISPYLNIFPIKEVPFFSESFSE